MRMIGYLFSLFSISALAAIETAQQKGAHAFERKDYSEAVKYYTEWTKEASKEMKGAAYMRLALSLYKDQEHEKAYIAFFKALSLTQTPTKSYVPPSEDSRLYAEALKTYMEPSFRDPETVAHQLRDQYDGLVRLHPDYLQLGYVMAAAYANLGQMDQFFELFYRSYLELPSHYFSYKSQAILHVKLMERARTTEEKEVQRALVVADLQKAKEIYPQDASIYRMQIAFASPQNKEEVLKRNLNEILNQSIVIPRADLSFYFDQLFAYRERELAEKLLNKARGWYPYSRTLNSVNEMLEEDK